MNDLTLLARTVGVLDDTPSPLRIIGTGLLVAVLVYPILVGALLLAGGAA